MIQLFTLLLIGGLTISAGTLRAQTYAIGRSLYQKGDIVGAEKALKAAFVKATAKHEKAKIALMLGIVSYTKGDRISANNHFQTALIYDPKIEINAQDVLDPSVESYFLKVQAEMSPPSLPSSAPQASPAATMSVAPSQVPTTAGSPIAPNTKPQKKTLLKVISSAPNAQVSIDGIYAGSTNSLINTDPGKVLVEVSSPGYETFRSTVQIVENQENTLSITLEKAQAHSKTPQADQSPENLVETGAVMALPTEAAPFKARSKKKGKSSKKSKAKGDDLFDSSERGVSKSKQGPRDLAREFEMDAAASAPLSPQFQQPAAPYPSLESTSEDPLLPPTYGSPPYQQPSYNPDAVIPPSPGTGPYRSATRSISVSSLMPLGIGQFAQKRPVMGILFFSSEAALAYMYYTTDKNASSYAFEANTYLRENCSPGPNQEFQGNAEAECKQYRARADTYFRELKGKAQLFLLSSVGIGILGIIEAVIWDTIDHSVDSGPALKKKRSKSKKYKGFSLHLHPQTENLTPLHLSSLGLTPKGSTTANRVAETPHTRHESAWGHKDVPTVAVEWRWNF